MSQKQKQVKLSRTSKPKRFELESAPGGYVVLKRLNHGLSTERLDTIMDQFTGEDGVRYMKASSMKARIFDFEHVIIDHNLAYQVNEEDDGDDPEMVKFDFSLRNDVFDIPEEVGDEIQGLINEFHGRVSAGIVETEDDEVPESDPN